MASSAQAQILVYRGAGTVYKPTDPYHLSPEGSFLIVENTGQLFHKATFIIYGKTKVGKTITKRYSVVYDQVVMDVAVPDQSNIEVFSYVNRVSPSQGSFSDDVAMFRGALANVTISGSPGAYVRELHAKTLAGTYRHFGEGFGTDYNEQRLTLVLDETRTIFANNGNQDLPTTESNVIASLISAGYSP
jgi:hypothetical protein